MTDLVYVLGSGSPWDNGELKFSLRSVEMFLSGVDKVFVVGAKPKWLTNVIHLPFFDHFPCKEKNIMLKLARACGHPDLSTNFLHLHDDHFCIYPQEASEVPFWCGGSLQNTANAVKPSNHWRDAVLNTHKALSAKGLTTNNFDLHYPMIFDKDKYPEIMDSYNWKEPRGYVVKSLYANTMKIKGERSPDLKIHERLSYGKLLERLNGRKWFSISNQGLSGEFKKFLLALYPMPSKYEISYLHAGYLE